MLFSTVLIDQQDTPNHGTHVFLFTNRVLSSRLSTSLTRSPVVQLVRSDEAPTIPQHL